MRAMCGRYVVAYDPNMLISGFSVTRVTPFPKRWNVTPMTPVPVAHHTRSGERVAELMRWGLLPHWAKDAKLAAKLNNARLEGIAEKPSFRQAMRRRRYLLPASGFHEWQATPSGKQPWYISPRHADGDEPVFAFAGLFEAWRAPDVSPDSEWLLTCCIITTTEANALMPLLTPMDPARMQAWPVPREVNRSSSEGEALIHRLPALA
jgi:putative SOS response-associated peptidase YedK